MKIKFNICLINLEKNLWYSYGYGIKEKYLIKIFYSFTKYCRHILRSISTSPACKVRFSEILSYFPRNWAWPTGKWKSC